MRSCLQGLCGQGKREREVPVGVLWESWRPEMPQGAWGAFELRAEVTVRTVATRMGNFIQLVTAQLVSSHCVVLIGPGSAVISGPISSLHPAQHKPFPVLLRTEQGVVAPGQVATHYQLRGGLLCHFHLYPFSVCISVL